MRWAYRCVVCDWALLGGHLCDVCGAEVDRGFPWEVETEGVDVRVLRACRALARRGELVEAAVLRRVLRELPGDGLARRAGALDDARFFGPSAVYVGECPLCGWRALCPMVGHVCAGVSGPDWGEGDTAALLAEISALELIV